MIKKGKERKGKRKGKERWIMDGAASGRAGKRPDRIE